MRRRAALVLALTLSGCAGDILGGDDDGADGGADVDGGGPDAGSGPDAGDPGASLGVFTLTYYWVAAEEDHPGVADTDVYDPDCAVITTTSADFFDALALEGTGRLLDGRVLNYDGPCGCANSPCFHEVDDQHPWGSGSMNRALVPFRSVAVDPSVVPIGTKLWVEAFDGLLMPGEAPWGDFIHDGCLSADDTGGGIDGAHIDFFAAIRDAYVELDGELGLNDVDVNDGGDRCP
jgi:3D (Asp-Asp-Asp) domain-containing protein